MKSRRMRSSHRDTLAAAGTAPVGMADPSTGGIVIAALSATMNKMV